jgi:hypothetical protein
MIANTFELYFVTGNQCFRDTKKPLQQFSVCCNPRHGCKVQSETCILAGYSDGKRCSMSETVKPEPVPL